MRKYCHVLYDACKHNIFPHPQHPKHTPYHSVLVFKFKSKLYCLTVCYSSPLRFQCVTGAVQDMFRHFPFPLPLFPRHLGNNSHYPLNIFKIAFWNARDSEVPGCILNVPGENLRYFRGPCFFPNPNIFYNIFYVYIVWVLPSSCIFLTMPSIPNCP